MNIKARVDNPASQRDAADGHSCARCRPGVTSFAQPAGLDELIEFCRWLPNAAAKIIGRSWTRGSWVIADPDGMLCAWLDLHPDGYWRISSHLTAADRQRFGARGIDLPAHSIPGTRLGTLLYQPFERHRERRLLLKLETAGARLLPVGAPVCRIPPHRAIRQRDLLETSHHVMSSIWRKGPWVLDRRGESFLDLAPAARRATMQLAALLDLPARAEVHAVALAGEQAVAQRRLAPDLLRAWLNELPLRADRPMEDVRLRIANEVVLLPGDLATAPLPSALCRR